MQIILKKVENKKKLNLSPSPKLISKAELFFFKFQFDIPKYVKFVTEKVVFTLSL